MTDATVVQIYWHCFSCHEIIGAREIYMRDGGGFVWCVECMEPLECDHD